MRALRRLLIVVLVLGVLFVVVDRVAVHFAESEAADKLKTSEGLTDTPDVSIKGFPFLTQVAGGELDDIEVGIRNYEAPSGDGGEKIRIDDLNADMKGVRFTGDYSSATAATATGTALISYEELLRTAKAEPTRWRPVSPPGSSASRTAATARSRSRSRRRSSARPCRTRSPCSAR